MDDSSPYEPVAPNRHPDAFGLASISSGITVVVVSKKFFFIIIIIFNIMDVFSSSFFSHPGKLSCLLVDDNNI